MKLGYFLSSLVSLLLLVAACGPQLQRPSVPPELVAREREEQLRLASKLRREREEQLTRVFSHLSTYGAEICEILSSTRGCTFQVDLKEDDAVNAATDGSRIVVHTGMLRFVRDDHELAVVLAHELAHNVLGHVDRTRGNQIIGGLLGLLVDLGIATAGVNTQGTFTRLGSQGGRLVYSQEFEMEADYLGLYFVARAGFDINRAPDFWRRMGIEKGGIEQNFAATHPSTPERSVLLERTIREIQNKWQREDRLIPDTLIEVARKSGKPLPAKDEVQFPALRPDRQPEIVARKDAPPRSTAAGTSAQRREQREATIRSAKIESSEKRLATLGSEAAKPAPMLYVKRAGANLYAQPGDYSKVTAKLQKGEVLTQLGLAFGMEDSLYKVQTQRGDIGWVRYADVEKKP
jgi:Zn-dependent protease with chaperone function